MRFPPLPTTHIYIEGKVLPYDGRPVEAATLYTEDHGETWWTAEEAGIPMLPPVKLPTKAQIIAARAAIVVEPLKEWEREALRCVKEIEDHFLEDSVYPSSSLGCLLAFAEASEVAPEPEVEVAAAPEPEIVSELEVDAEPAPFIEEMEDSIYCEYGETQYRWNFRPHKGGHYQKTNDYNLFEWVPVDHYDFSQKISFDDLDKELILEEKIERTGRSKYSGDPSRRYTYSMFVEFRGATYEVVLVVTED